MKRKVIRVCSLVLLSVAVSTTLVGCGSKSEKDTAASSTTSTSKVVKSSAKTKSSEKKSAKKAKTEASASKDSQGQEEVSAPEASSSKNQATAGTDGQAGTSSSADSESESNKSSQATTDTQSDAPVPAALVGTWTGTSPKATDISFTVDADGNITSKANFNVDYEPYRQSSTTAQAVQISGNLYVWEGGDFSTLLPGITGLGGAGFQAKPGFILENGTYTPVQFISDLGPTFDYSNYNAFPFSLTK